MRPTVRILSDDDIDKIIEGAVTVLSKSGMHIGSKNVLHKIGDQSDATISGDRALLGRDLVEYCLKQAPSEISIFRQDASKPLKLSGDNVHYVAGSVAPYIYDANAVELREPKAIDLAEHIKVLNQCNNIDFQSGSFVISDAPKQIASSYRYYLSLLYSPKPIFGGAFGIDDLKVIHNMLSIVAGGKKELKQKPIAVIATNPSSPLGLTEIVATNLVYCAENGLPAMLIPIPLAGGSSPVTLAGTLVQHTAEIIGSIVVSQVANAGAPVIFGGGPSIMDMQKGTACQASTESVIMGISIGQIAKKLGLPTATNTGRADSKKVDYQAGEESGIALTLMALAGINMIRGAGTLEFANVVSKEKLLIDNEICGMAKRLVQPLNTSDEGFAIDVILERATSADGYLSSDHTLKLFRSEFFFPSALIDRGSRREFEEKGSQDVYERAVDKVDEILKNYVPREFDPAKKDELDVIINKHSAQFGMDKLPLTNIE